MARTRILLIGNSGQLGSDVEILLSSNPENEVITKDLPDFSIADEKQVHDVIGELKPDFVINAAAYVDVAGCEQHPEKSFLINGIALKFLADACTKAKSVLIHYSTDYVFGSDSERREPYQEADPVGPVQVYGMSKVTGEQMVQQYCPRHLILRIAGLYGIKGTQAKKFPNFVEMMIHYGSEAEKKAKAEGKKRGTLPVVADQIMSFTYTVEVAKATVALMNAVKNAKENGKGGSTEPFGLYHASCRGAVTRLEFTEEIFKEMGIAVDCTPVTSDYFKVVYQQPPFTGLDLSKLDGLGIHMADWKDALHAYLEQRKELKK